MARTKATIDPADGSATEQLNVFGRLESWFIDGKRAKYGSAMLRVLLAIGALASVAVNFSDRRYLWGTTSAWTQPFRDESAWNFFPFNFFSATDPDWLLVAKLAVLGIASVSMLLGWHARASTIVVLILFTSLVALGPTSVDSTDNAFRLMLFYSCFLDTGRRWSLDARRHRRTGSVGRRSTMPPPEPGLLGRFVPRWFTNIVHNLAVVAVGAQVILIYAIAGATKLRGELWRDGTGVYYPLLVDNYRPWPAVNDFLAGINPLIYATTWGTVALQLSFGLLLLTRPTRIFAVVAMLGMHAGIGIFMGLAVFSLAMMAGDVIFIRDSSVEKMRDWLHRRRQSSGESAGEVTNDGAPAAPTGPTEVTGSAPVPEPATQRHP